MGNLLGNIKVEITVRNQNGVEFEIPSFLNKYLDGRKKDKIIFMVPGEWIGFKNGFSKNLTRSGLDVYFALAFSTTGDEVVTDKEGNVVRPFIHNFPGGVMFKYVKKNLTISDTGGKKTYRVSLNLSEKNPISVEIESGD